MLDFSIIKAYQIIVHYNELLRLRWVNLNLYVIPINLLWLNMIMLVIILIIRNSYTS